jgi:ankyrin repeat protein
METIKLLTTPEWINHGKETPLHVAIQMENLPVVRHLLQSGSDVSMVRPTEETEDISDFPEEAKEQLKKPWPKTMDTCLNLSLVSCSGNQIPLMILEAYPKHVNVAMGRRGLTPLHFAVQRRDVTLVSALLKNGADPTIQRRDTGETALMQCLAMGEDEYIGMIRRKRLDENMSVIRDVILEHSHTFDVQDWDGWTALHVVAVEDDFHTCEKMLVKGADPNLVNRDGNSALHLAARELWQDTVRVIAKFVSLETKMRVNGDGKRPVDYWPEMYTSMLGTD